MAPNLTAMASTLIPMASNLIVMPSNLIVMASTLIAMASTLVAITRPAETHMREFYIYIFTISYCLMHIWAKALFNFTLTVVPDHTKQL